MMEPTFVAEGEHIRYTAEGIVLMGEYSRAVTARCTRCGLAIPLRLCCDDPPDDATCDALLDAYLEGLGWDRVNSQDVCADCLAK